MQKNIGDLEISVDHIFFSQVVKTIEDIFNYRFCSILVEVTIFSESWLKIPFVTQFGNDITVAIAGKNFKTFENIRVAKFFEHIDFREKKFLKLFTFEGLELYDFDGHNFVYIDGDILVFYLLAL